MGSRKFDSKAATCSTEGEACEVIELAAADLELLARAFDLIADICEQRAIPKPQLPLVSEDSPLIH